MNHKQYNGPRTGVIVITPYQFTILIHSKSKPVMEVTKALWPKLKKTK